jgi:site-specific recombinase XerD
MSVSTKFILKIKNEEPDRTAFPIMVQIIIDRKLSFVSTKKTCTKADWQNEQQKVKKSDPNHKDINAVLSAISSDINFLILSSGKISKPITQDDIKTVVKRLTGAEKRPETKKLFEIYEEHLEYLEKMERLGDKATFKSSYNSLKTFTDNKDYDLLNIDVNFLRRYEDYLVLRKNAITSRSVYLRTFRRLWNIAIKNKYCPEDHYPFKEFSFSKYNNPRTKKRAIPKLQIDLLANLEIDKDNDTLLDSRNFFIFMFYSRGLNFADLASLKWTDIKDHELNFTRQKTKEQFQFKLHPVALEIIAYYRNLEGNSDAGYVFPVLYKRHNSAKSIRERKKKILKRINKDMKELAKIAGIEKNLTTYVARHSFATALLRNGIDIAQIQQSLGHDDLATTRIYLEDVGDPLFDEVINNAL